MPKRSIVWKPNDAARAVDTIANEMLGVLEEDDSPTEHAWCVEFGELRRSLREKMRVRALKAGEFYEDIQDERVVADLGPSLRRAPKSNSSSKRTN